MVDDSQVDADDPHTISQQQSILDDIMTKKRQRLINPNGDGHVDHENDVTIVQHVKRERLNSQPIVCSSSSPPKIIPPPPPLSSSSTPTAESAQMAKSSQRIVNAPFNAIKANFMLTQIDKWIRLAIRGAKLVTEGLPVEVLHDLREGINQMFESDGKCSELLESTIVTLRQQYPRLSYVLWSPLHASPGLITSTSIKAKGPSHDIVPYITGDPQHNESSNLPTVPPHEPTTMVIQHHPIPPLPIASSYSLPLLMSPRPSYDTSSSAAADMTPSPSPSSSLSSQSSSPALPSNPPRVSPIPFVHESPLIARSHTPSPTIIPASPVPM